jgi:uncharacterized protein YjbI with pentapeptide repeats
MHGTGGARLGGIVVFVTGTLLGISLTWALLFSALDRYEPAINFFLHVLLPIFGLFGAGLVIAGPLVWWRLKRFTAGATGALDQVSAELAGVVSSSVAGDAPNAIDHVQRALRETIAWSGPLLVRRWVLQTGLAVLVSVGGLIGTALLFRQTILLREQNEKLQEQTLLLRDQNQKIDLQTITAEAQRRAGLSAELFAILGEVSKLSSRGAGVLELDRGLRARIVTLSRAATPYWTVDVQTTHPNRLMHAPSLTDRPRSPERGQLLVGLALAGVQLDTLPGVTFESADLRSADLSSTRLSAIDLSQADLSSANLSRADLRETRLTGADLRAANLRGADLNEADLQFVDLSRANLGSANLVAADLSKANLRIVSLAGAKLNGAALIETDLTEADFSGADLSRADFSNAQIAKADFTDAVVGAVSAEGQLPLDFPKGWTLPPTGWHIDYSGLPRLRRTH